MSFSFYFFRVSVLFISLLLLQGCILDEDTDDPLIGHLAGPVIAGVTYQTDSGSGITDSSGQFEYEEGESIRFLLGATVLGDTVAAKASMTPLDLIGGAVLYTNATQVNNVVHSNLNNPARVALYRFHNVLTFLMYLDDDRDPTNGVNISTEVAALFDAITVDFYFNKSLSVSATGMYQSLYQAVRDGLLLTLTMPPSGYALDQYYQINNIESSLAVSMFKTTDEQNDGTIEYSYVHEFDSEGNLIRDGYSVDGQTQRDSRYTFNQWFQPDISTDDNDGDGIIDRRSTREYNALGQIVSTYIDNNGDNDSSTQADYIFSYEYNEAGVRIRSIIQSDPIEVEGVITYTTVSRLLTRTVSDDGSQVTEISTIDDNNYTTTISTYHSSGLILSSESITIEDGEVVHQSTLTKIYDENLNILSNKRVTVGGFSFEDINTYDDNGYLISQGRDSDVDGNLDNLITNGYSDAGQRIIREFDSDADGVVDYWSTYTFDEYGNVSTRSHFNGSSGEEPSAVYSFAYDENQNLLSSTYFHATETFFPELASWRAVLREPKIQQ